MIKLYVDNTSKISDFHLYENYLYRLANRKNCFLVNNFADDNSDIKNLWMVRVSTNQFSTLTNKTVKTRADAFLICVKFSSYYCTQQEKAQVRKQWEIVGRREAGKTDAQRHK